MTSQLDDSSIVRRRRCDNCGHRWYTHQPPEEAVSRYVLQWSPYGKIIAIKSQ